MSERTYQLKLATGKVVTWVGRDGENAARRYVDAHRDAVVVATREDRAPQIRVGYGEITGPGEQ